MNILVVGATGMTGMPLVEQLLAGGHKVRAIVRSDHKFLPEIRNHLNLELVKASILDLSNVELRGLVKDCDAVVSCLGHVLNFHGVFGEPRNLCTQSVQRLCTAIEDNRLSRSTKFVLMNTVGVANPERSEKRTWFEKFVLVMLHYLMPPHRDNEMALNYLYERVGQNNRFVDWSVVRPDSLINADVSPFEIGPSPVTGLFSGRPTTRANVAKFMKSLVEDASLWAKWRYKMPVIMNKVS